MFFILIDHFSMVTGMLPSQQVINDDLVLSFFKILLLSVAIGGVDIFILISGWFGIHPSKRGLTKYIYQVCFLLWLLLVFFFFFDKQSINIQTIKASFWIYNGYWFIIAYLGLYLLSPILNTFVENSTKKQFQIVLLSLYLFQCYFCWITNELDYYGGYSIVFFCILYLTARYLRIYPIQILEKRSFFLYPVIIAIIASVAYISIAYTGTAMRMLRYDNPLVILSSLCLLSIVYKWKFSSKFINGIAASCLAVYIIHFNPLVFQYFAGFIIRIYNNTNGFMYVVESASFLCFVFLFCVLIDRLRILTWNGVLKILQLKNRK